MQFEKVTIFINQFVFAAVQHCIGLIGNRNDFKRYIGTQTMNFEFILSFIKSKVCKTFSNALKFMRTFWSVISVPHPTL